VGSEGRLKRPPSILTERGFDRRLAAMIVIAFAAHLLLLGVAAFMGEFKVRPNAPIEAYTVEIVDDGELGGHMPAGLPKLDLGGEQAAKRQPPKQAPSRKEPPPAPKPPEPEPPEPPEPAEPPPAPEPAKPEAAKEEPPLEPVAAAKPPREDDLIVATATPTAAPTARPTPRPTVQPTASPRPTATPTPRPAASARPTSAPPRPSATQAQAPVKSPRPTAGRSPGPAAKPTASPVIVVKPRPTPTGARGAGSAQAQASPQAAPTSASDARIAAALERVQRSVGSAPSEGGSASGGGARAPGADARGTGGVGGTDAPDPNRRIGIGPGRGGAGEVRGVEFLLYYNRMLARIREAWVYTGGATTAEVNVRFRILDDGVVADLRVTTPSGDAAYDASVLRAVRAASPLGPPPEKFRADFADVELTFQPGDLKAAP